MRALCGIALWLTTSLAGADDKQDARAHVVKATDAHARGDFEAALSELEVAYELDPMPELLFATAQLHVRLERCAAAITYYERYLKTNPARQAKLDTQQAIATCKQRIADANVRRDPPERAAPAPTPPPTTPAAATHAPRRVAPAARPVPPPTTPPPTTPPPWYRDRVGGVLVASGAVAGITAIVLYGRARSSLDDAESAQSISDYRSSVNDAHGMRTLAIVFGVSSSVLIGAGVIRYGMKRTPQHEARFAIVPDRGGGIVTWSGGF